jgi:hypothetical protein
MLIRFQPITVANNGSFRYNVGYDPALWENTSKAAQMNRELQRRNKK